MRASNMENDSKLKLDVKNSSSDGLLATAAAIGSTSAAAVASPPSSQANGNAINAQISGNHHQVPNLGSLKSETSSNASVNGSIKKCSPATVLMNSREDVTSLGGGSSVNSQTMSHGNHSKHSKGKEPQIFISHSIHFWCTSICSCECQEIGRHRFIVPWQSSQPRG